MIDVQNTPLDEAACWLELANGGGVMLQQPGGGTPSEPITSEIARRSASSRLARIDTTSSNQLRRFRDALSD